MDDGTTTIDRGDWKSYTGDVLAMVLLGSDGDGNVASGLAIIDMDDDPIPAIVSLIPPNGIVSIGLLRRFAALWNAGRGYTNDQLESGMYRVMPVNGACHAGGGTCACGGKDACEDGDD